MVLYCSIADEQPDMRCLSRNCLLVILSLAFGGVDVDAASPETDYIARQSQHWAYVSPRRSDLPDIRDANWPKNPIDYFVVAKMADRDLRPSSQAAAARLLRRVYLDLIGLPPSPAAVAAFLRDPTDEAYTATVDRLLASPRYGEKWARHWLDLARYSDSNGYQADQLRDMWAYRDWVIDAMNADMPFDQFTIEQIAGDLLPAATQAQQIATGFHRTPTCNVEAGVDPESNRTDQVIDRVNTTGTVWLGTTIECAQCHDHKYDSFSQREYYQLFAFFNNTPIEVKNSGKASDVQFNFYGPTLEFPMSAEALRRKEHLTTQVRHLKEKVAQLEKAALEELPAWEETVSRQAGNELPESVVAALELPAKQRSQEQQRSVRQHFLAKRSDVTTTRTRLKELRQQRDAVKPNSTLVMVEMPEPRETRVFLRGQFLTPGEIVRPDVPSGLHAMSRGAPPNRLGLAQWLVSTDNPLVARVTVNRWWYQFFGRGLVATAEDFGTEGEPPTHPQLLDWLAVELMDNEWSMKHIHKLIVTSATYRQASQVTPVLLAADPHNRLYARGPRTRMSAEMIRDNALAISGLLGDNMGGAPVFPPQPPGLWNQAGRNEPKYVTAEGESRFRRGIYVIWRRAAPYPSFVNFDAPDRMSCVVTRPTTNTPLQALTLLNDEAYAETAWALAARVLAEIPNATDDERLSYAFRLCVARTPTVEELNILVETLKSERDQLTLMATEIDKLIESLPFGFADAIDKHEWSTWFSIANILLNLDETITKG
jgi:hypothetical protein